MPEMWARCEPCDRWFFVPFDSGQRMARCRCPVCASFPVNFEVRMVDSTFPVEINGRVAAPS